MDKQEFLTELGRLGSICPKAGRFTDAKEDQAYIGELERKYMRLPGHVWKDVITKIIDSHKSNRLPMPHQFTDAVRSVYSETPGAHRVCSSCNDIEMVYKHYIHRQTNAPIKAMIPCPQCRPGTAGWQLNDDLIEVTSPESGTQMERMARALTTSGAKHVLEEAERSKTKLPESVMAILLERTCEQPAQKEE